MSHRAIVGDHVPIPATLSMAGEAATVLEVLHDALYCPFGDADRVGQVAQPHLRVTSQADEHMAVIGEERPARSRHLVDRSIISVVDDRSCHPLILRNQMRETPFINPDAAHDPA
jgi:hypothetical protein